MSEGAGEGSRRHLLHVFATFHTGGPAVRAAQLMGMMQAQGKRYRHTVLSMDARTDCTALVPQGVELRLLPPPPQLGFLRMGRFLRDLIVAEQPDLVLTYNWGAIEGVLACRQAKRFPLVHHEDGFGPEESERFLRRRIWARRVLLPTAGAIVVPSLTLRELAVRRWRQPERRVHYLPNGVDLWRFAPADGDARDTASDDVVIGHVGDLRGEKNQALLLRAFARCEERDRARLLFYGDGPDEESLRQLAAELLLEERVTFAGATADTSKVYREMDVLALSSKTEQMPLTVLEAMACGLPVVSPDVGDVRVMVDEHNQDLIIPKNDVAALAAALDRVIADPDLRHDLGQRNRERCEQQYDSRVCYQRYLDLYRTFTAGRSADTASAPAR